MMLRHPDDTRGAVIEVDPRGVIDLDAMTPEFRRGWEARGPHIPSWSAWRGLCGHLWDRAVEDTDVCPRCSSR